MKKNNICKRVSLPLATISLLLSCFFPSQAQATILTFGDGADGAITVSAAKNINTDPISAGRVTAGKADGEAWNVSALTSTTATVTGTGTDGTAAASVGTSIFAGDEVLLINLQGTSTAFGNVGNYEILEVQSRSGAIITFTTTKTKYYGTTTDADDANLGTAVSNQRVMLQRVPNYTNVTINSSQTLTANAWNGAMGGVVAFKANGTTTVTGTISTSALGFRGGDTHSSASRYSVGRSGESYKDLGTNTTSRNDGGGGGGATGADGTINTDGGGGGGGYGTAGGNGGAVGGVGGTGGLAYGVADLSDLYLGSGGGKWELGGSGSGQAGGIIFISSDTFTVSGSMLARGNVCTGYSGGCSSGGSIKIIGGAVTLGSSLVNAIAQTPSGATPANGTGGSGRIRVEYEGSISGTTNPAASTLYTPPPIPTAPTIGSPTALSNTSIRWGFTDNASNETGFKVYDTSNVLKATCASANLTYCDETGLTANTSYTRKVVAYNAAGNSTYSATATISTLPNVPAAPTIGTPNALLTGTQIRWFFTDNASNETGFKVYDTSNVLKRTCAVADLTSCLESNLSPNTSYTRKVVAYNDGGNSSYSQTATISTTALPCKPLLSQDTHSINSVCYFDNLMIDHTNGNRHITGLFGGSLTDNTSVLTINAAGELTINSDQTLVAGEINITTGGQIFIATGAIIELDKPVWVIDADGDGFPGSNGAYVQTSNTLNVDGTSIEGVRLNSLTTTTLDCNDNTPSATNTCTNCAPGDTPATVGSDLYGTTCKKCVDGYAVNQTDIQDLFSQCTTASPGAANSCKGANCNGAGACGYIAAGEASQAVCKRCSGSSYDPVNISINLQDTEGSNLCNQTCKKCNGTGSCVIQASNEDQFNQCTADNCDTGNCNGTTAACHNGGTWTESCQTCCTQNQLCAGGNGCGNCASGPFSGCSNYYVPYPTPPAAEICRCTYCQINYNCNCTWSCQ